MLFIRHKTPPFYIRLNITVVTALIITWGGLRGGLSIALALNLPDSLGGGKDLILFLTYAVVLFTILVQGLTLKKIVK